MVHVTLDLSKITRAGLTEIIVANEQGAGYFDAYGDSSGTRLHGKRIGTWDEVKAESASMIDSGKGVAFTVFKKNDVRLMRGRELQPRRLAWAGLNYILPANTLQFAYDIEFGEHV